MVFVFSLVVATTRTTGGDWIKASPFHVSCVRRCVNKSTLVVLRPKRPYFAPPLQGCTRPTSRVPTPFDPLSSFTGGGNWTPSGFRHALVKKRSHRVQTRPTSVYIGPNTIKQFESVWTNTHRSETCLDTVVSFFLPGCAEIPMASNSHRR